MSSKKITAVCAGLVGMAALVAFPAGAGAATFSNQNTISIGASSVANTYPSNIDVSGLTGPITKARATLFGITGTGTNRMQVLLVGPGGQSVVLMRSACGDVANGYTLGFDDAAATTLPNVGNCNGLSGTFKPSDFDPADNSFTAPAPAKPYGSTMSVFNATQPNGTWRLFIEDDIFGGIDFHTVGGGWSLDLDTAAPPANAATIPVAKKKCAKRNGAKRKPGAKKKCRKKKKK